jgi:hypothetical protein
MFTLGSLDNLNVFDELVGSTKFEVSGRGRQGAILADYRDGLIPIIRTTTEYTQPIQPFNHIHYNIIDLIQKKLIHNIKVNNAMAEIYDSRYRKMGFHTDQALDLDDDSYICLFSCYENNSTDIADMRTLQVKNKTDDNSFSIPMRNNSFIIFDKKTNGNHVHKIILDSTSSKNRWCGITFRLSKTFVKFVDDVPYINDVELTMVTDEQKINFRKCKGAENSEVDYHYPEINYTISASDLMKPTEWASCSLPCSD